MTGQGFSTFIDDLDIYISPALSDQGLFFCPGQLFNGRFPAKSRAPVLCFLLIDQLYRKAGPSIFRSLAAVVDRRTADGIVGASGIERPVSTLENIDVIHRLLPAFFLQIVLIDFLSSREYDTPE